VAIRSSQLRRWRNCGIEPPRRPTWKDGRMAGLQSNAPAPLPLCARRAARARRRCDASSNLAVVGRSSGIILVVSARLGIGAGGVLRRRPFAASAAHAVPGVQGWQIRGSGRAGHRAGQAVGGVWKYRARRSVNGGPMPLSRLCDRADPAPHSAGGELYFLQLYRRGFLGDRDECVIFLVAGRRSAGFPVAVAVSWRPPFRA